jgi:hypothetical protein
MSKLSAWVKCTPKARQDITAIEGGVEVVVHKQGDLLEDKATYTGPFPRGHANEWVAHANASYGNDVHAWDVISENDIPEDVESTRIVEQC